MSSSMSVILTDRFSKGQQLPDVLLTNVFTALQIVSPNLPDGLGEYKVSAPAPVPSCTHRKNQSLFEYTTPGFVRSSLVTRTILSENSLFEYGEVIFQIDINVQGSSVKNKLL